MKVFHLNQSILDELKNEEYFFWSLDGGGHSRTNGICPKPSDGDLPIHWHHRFCDQEIEV